MSNSDKVYSQLLTKIYQHDGDAPFVGAEREGMLDAFRRIGVNLFVMQDALKQPQFLDTVDSDGKKVKQPNNRYLAISADHTFVKHLDAFLAHQAASEAEKTAELAMKKLEALASKS